MYVTPQKEQLQQLSRHEFEKLQRVGSLRQMWAAISGHEHRLLHLKEVTHEKQIRTRSDIGIQTVDIGSIHGSESRNRDFDRAWRPLGRVKQARWTSIAMAHMTATPLPAVDLIKVDDGYFVRDGHHRISVARHRGQVAIEANVTVWHVSNEPGHIEVSAPSHSPHGSQPRLIPLGKALSHSTATIVNLFETLNELASKQHIAFLRRRPHRPMNRGTTA